MAFANNNTPFNQTTKRYQDMTEQELLETARGYAKRDWHYIRDFISDVELFTKDSQGNLVALTDELSAEVLVFRKLKNIKEKLVGKMPEFNLPAQNVAPVQAPVATTPAPVSDVPVPTQLPVV